MCDFRRGSVMMPSNADGSIRYADTHYIDTWKAMETLVDQGLVKAIGLSNFNARQTDLILSIARHKPVVNQVCFIIFKTRAETMVLQLQDLATHAKGSDLVSWKPEHNLDPRKQLQ